MTNTFTGVDTQTFPGYPGVRLNFRAVNASFAQWQASGQDSKSIVADPLFIAADPVKANDFRMRSVIHSLSIAFTDSLGSESRKKLHLASVLFIVEI